MWEDNLSVCAARKVWRQVKREGFSYVRVSVASRWRPPGLALGEFRVAQEPRDEQVLS